MAEWHACHLQSAHFTLSAFDFFISYNGASDRSARSAYMRT
jgi:hypothetical protein